MKESCDKCGFRKRATDMQWVLLKKQRPEGRVLVKKRNGYIEIAEMFTDVFYDDDGQMITGVLKWMPIPK